MAELKEHGSSDKSGRESIPEYAVFKGEPRTPAAVAMLNARYPLKLLPAAINARFTFVTVALLPSRLPQLRETALVRNGPGPR